jgi:hypothetical protein
MDFYIELHRIKWDILMLPDFNLSGVLPPFLGADPASGGAAAMSPYLTDPVELVNKLNSSPERLTILRGFLDYRRDLMELGFQGWQWIDGSFVENVEATQGRHPGDIDVVTFTNLPSNLDTQAKIDAFSLAYAHLINPKQAKAKYKCDAYFIQLSSPRPAVKLASYFLGLFSHQRETAVWKGMLELETFALIVS